MPETVAGYRSAGIEELPDLYDGVFKLVRTGAVVIREERLPLDADHMVRVYEPPEWTA
ncbi:MAG TPA: hypothetical protein VHJ39_09750 [Solirubrobacteraceae bacterium]|jgi:hypothetical protein|nr:hypothetical protein [Solirubrobacteraceae bacterium]